MYNKLRSLALTAMVSGLVFSCQPKEEATVQPDAAVSDATLSQIRAMGFSTKGAVRTEGGYLVEGDIFLAESALGKSHQLHFLRVGTEEQYRTTNLVTGLPRVITLSISNRLPASYATALDEVARRYNALGLRLTFQRVASGGNIDIVRANGSYLASAGFPTSTGSPHNQVKVNSNAIGTGTSSTFINYVATILAHEIGHCIGFRHTDYMNRAYSCGGATSNEGASTVGAILIDGTPSGPDPNSWMLACIGANQNRPFNANDITALNFLY